MSATVALPIQRLRPCRIQPPSGWRRAWVASRTTSEPCSGSVSAKAPSRSTAAIDGSQRCFWASEPSIPIVVMASPECTPWKVAMLPSPRANSAATRPSASGDSPGQPWSAQRPAGHRELPVAGHQRHGNSARSQ